MYNSLLKFDKENFIKKHNKKKKNPKIQTNTQNPLKTSLFNLIWSYWVVIDLTSMVDHVWPNIDKVLQTLTTHFSQSNRLIVVILRQHQYLTTFFQSNGWILDLSLEHYGHVLLLPKHQEILIGYVRLIQPFDWAQNPSKPIFYPTLSM